MKYLIQLTICREHGPQFERTAYVARVPRWDGAWLTERIEDARVYVSKTWAQKWLADRPTVRYAEVISDVEIARRNTVRMELDRRIYEGEIEVTDADGVTTMRDLA